MEKQNEFIESLKRLYEDKKIDENTLKSLMGRKTITQEDKEYIMSTIK